MLNAYFVLTFYYAIYCIVQHHRIVLYKYGAIEINKHLHLILTILTAFLINFDELAYNWLSRFRVTNNIRFNGKRIKLLSPGLASTSSGSLVLDKRWRHIPELRISKLRRSHRHK